jgi:hypothetical protein
MTRHPHSMKPPLVEVAIYLCGKRLQPAHVSQVLNLQPSKSQTKGGPTCHSTKFIAKVGLWALVAQSHSTVVSDHIEELLKKIGSPPTPLDEIDGVEAAQMDVFVAVEDDDEKTIQIVIPRSQLKEIVQLGLSAQFTLG